MLERTGHTPFLGLSCFGRWHRKEKPLKLDKTEFRSHSLSNTLFKGKACKYLDPWTLPSGKWEKNSTSLPARVVERSKWYNGCQSTLYIEKFYIDINLQSSYVVKVLNYSGYLDSFLPKAIYSQPLIARKYNSKIWGESKLVIRNSFVCKLCLHCVFNQLYKYYCCQFPLILKKSAQDLIPEHPRMLTHHIL